MHTANTGICHSIRSWDERYCNALSARRDRRTKRLFPSGFSAPRPADPCLAIEPRLGQSWNAYSYVMNSPLDFTDPTGLDPVDKHSDCTYFSDGCGNGLKDPIDTVKNPGDSVVKTTGESVSYGSGALGWGTVGWANAGPAGVLQSGSEGYTEFGLGQLGRSSQLSTPKGEIEVSKGDWSGGTSSNAKDPVLLVGPWIRALGMSPAEIKEEADKLLTGMVEMAAWELGIGAAKTAVSVLRNLPRLAEAASAVIRSVEVVERPAETLSTGGAAARGAGGWIAGMKGLTRGIVLKNATAAGRGGVSAAGRALQKHSARAGSWLEGLASGNAHANTATAQRGMQGVFDAGTATTGTHPALGNIIRIRLPDGAGFWLKESGEFIRFLERYTPKP